MSDDASHSDKAAEDPETPDSSVRFSPASVPDINGATPSEDMTLVGGDDSAKPKTVHYQRGSFDETTMVSGETGSSGGTFRGFSTASSDAAAQARVSQMQYNHNRVALDRSINTAAHFVHDLRTENASRPVYYPTSEDPDLDARLNSRDSRIAIMRAKTAGSPSPEPQETASPFQILKINFRLDPGSNSVVGNLDKAAVSTFVDNKLGQVQRHLSSLKDRIDDTSSKVLVTGDLNSGKSAFCNALLRRTVLPEDQEPCTSVFCEIIDSSENQGVEEVHAVPIGSTYDRADHRTYTAFKLSDLDDLVYDAQTYSLLIVYVRDNRPASQSLLRNGVIDIRLIDAPGLNLDSFHTTQLFSRQEEIDLVVFVVNAENHFTLSGRQFISNAANDKNLMFIVVNKFDQIKNKDRCKGRIMQQLQPLSPETYKNADEFVHFVSARDAKNPGGDPGDPGDGDEPAGRPDFDRLEAALRNFILEKRSLSKLLPVKTYLCKLYEDMETLAKANEKVYKKERAQLQSQLDEVSPQYESAVQNSVKVNESVMKLIDDSSSQAYDFSKNHIRDVINAVGEAPLGVAFKGYSAISEYAISTQEEVINRILQSVAEAEDHARQVTSDAIDSIRVLGRQYLDEKTLPSTKFVPEAMYSRNRDSFSRRIETKFSFMDFVDPSVKSFCEIFHIRLPGASTSAMLATLFSRVWKTSLSGVVVIYGPQILSTLTGIHSVTSLLPAIITRKVLPAIVVTAGIGLPLYYLYTDAPHAYQRKVVRKIKQELEQEDYMDVNSRRISKEVRKVLNYPANDVSIGMNTLIESHSTKRVQLIRDMKKGDAGMKFYKRFLDQVKAQRTLVQSYDLMGVD